MRVQILLSLSEGWTLTDTTNGWLLFSPRGRRVGPFRTKDELWSAINRFKIDATLIALETLSTWPARHH